jgi:Tol biopolymer transport system component
VGRSRHRLRPLATRKAIAARLGLVAALALAGAGCGSSHEAVANGLIAANWQGQGIFLVDPATSKRHRLPGTESAAALAWSPNGRTLAFELPGKVLGVDVYTIRSDGSGLRLVLRNAYGPSWSPNGKRLLIARDRTPGSRADVLTVRPDGSGLRLLARETGGVFSLALSPDGKRIAFLGNSRDLYLMNTDGKHRRRLAGTFGGRLSWSPDSSRLAFEIRGEAPNWGDIGVVDVSSGKRENLTHRPGYDSGPAWSPDGRKIAFLADLSCAWTGKCNPDWQEEGPRELWLMDSDGAHLRQLTRSGGVSGYDDPVWRSR